MQSTPSILNSLNEVDLLPHKQEVNMTGKHHKRNRVI